MSRALPHLAAPLLLAALAGAAPAEASDDRWVAPLVQLQVWGTAFDMDEDPQADPAGYGDPEHDPGFTLRRGRIGFEGQYDRLYFQLDLGANAPYDALSGAPDVRLTFANAFARMGWEVGPGEGRVRLGLVRIPFARERLMSSRRLVFQERAVGTSWIAPPQDIGVLAEYELDMGLRAMFGVYNGSGTLFGDDNNGNSIGGLLMSGRLEYYTDEASTYRTFGQADGVDFGIATAFFFDDDLANQTFAYEADLVLRLWRVSLLGEVMMATLTPTDTTVGEPAVLEPTEQLGWTAQLSYFQPMPGEGETDLDTERGVEAAVRFGAFDDAMAYRDNGDVGILHAGLTLRDALPGVDVGALYVGRFELGGRTIPNDTIRLTAQVRWPAAADSPRIELPDLATAAPPEPEPAVQAAPTPTPEPPAVTEPEPEPERSPFTGTWRADLPNLAGLVLYLNGEGAGPVDGSFQGRLMDGSEGTWRFRTVEMAAADRFIASIDLTGDPGALRWIEASPETEDRLCGLTYESTDPPKPADGDAAELVCFDRLSDDLGEGSEPADVPDEPPPFAQ